MRTLSAKHRGRERAGARSRLPCGTPAARRVSAAALLVAALLLPQGGGAEEADDPRRTSDRATEASGPAPVAPASGQAPDAPAGGPSPGAEPEPLPRLGPPLRAPPTLRDRASDALEAADAVVAPVFDVIVLRPLGAAATVVGVPFFVASAPFVGPTGGLSRAFDLFVYAPVDYTFLRPLGEF